MNKELKRFLAREVIWLLYGIIAVVAEIGLQYLIDRLWYKGIWNATDEEYRSMSHFLEYLFYAYLILAYPGRYLYLLSKWAFAVLNEKQSIEQKINTKE